LKQSVEEMRAPGVAAFLFDVFRGAELREGAAARFGRVHARCNVVSDLLLNVGNATRSPIAFRVCLCKING